MFPRYGMMWLVEPLQLLQYPKRLRGIEDAKKDEAVMVGVRRYSAGRRGKSEVKVLSGRLNMGAEPQNYQHPQGAGQGGLSAKSPAPAIS